MEDAKSGAHTEVVHVFNWVGDARIFVEQLESILQREWEGEDLLYKRRHTRASDCLKRQVTLAS